jgi:hypothetical protein
MTIPQHYETETREFDTLTLYAAVSGLNVTPLDDLVEFLSFMVGNPLLPAELSAARDFVLDSIQEQAPELKHINPPRINSKLSREAQHAVLDQWKASVRELAGPTWNITRPDVEWDPLIPIAHAFGTRD